jgi:HPt (histidine-containing phosphotransfer) domain-containing protein
MMNEYLLDPTPLQQYEELFGEDSAEFISDIIDTFLEESERIFAELEDSLAIDDQSTFRRAAHTMKSGCATVGAMEISEKFFSLEELGAQNQLSKAHQTLLECRSEFSRVRAALLLKRASYHY